VVSQRGKRLLSARRRKAPVALLSFRSVLLAVFVAALLISLASSSSPFVTTAAASEALKNRLDELTPFATGLQIQGSIQLYHRTEPSLLAQMKTYERAAGKLARSLHGVGAPVVTAESSTEYAVQNDTPVVLMNRTGALEHVKILSRVSGPGVWISSIVADTEHLKAGSTLRLANSFGSGRPLAMRIAGVYRALAHSPETSYWINFDEQIYQQDPDSPPPPSFVFVTNSRLFHALLATGQAQGRSAGGASGVATVLELPVDPRGMTLQDARRLEAALATVPERLRGTWLGQHLGCPVGSKGCTVISSLSSAVILANGNAAAVTVPVSLLSDVGTAIALGVAAAAGTFLVRRRRAEAALAYMRGEPPAAFAGRTAVEVLLPMLAGAAAGFGLAYAFTGIFAPAGSTDPATVGAAAGHAAVAVAAGLALLVGAATVAFLRLFETGARPASWLRFVPWELPLLAVAIYLLWRISSGGGLAGNADEGTAHPTLAVFVFPLLLIAAVAGLAARAFRLSLRVASPRVARSRRTAPYLAARRLAAARGLLVLLAVVSAVALGAFTYSEALASSLAHSTAEKAYMATGSDAQVEVLPGEPLPAHFAYPITRVEFSNESASFGGPSGTQADVMLVDPKTMVEAIHWESDWGPSPVGLLRQLGGAPSSPLPVIVTSDAAGIGAIWLEGKRFPVNVIGTVSAFPERTPGIPLVLTTARALDDVTGRAKVYDPLGVVQAYVWAKGPPEQAERALVSATSLGAYYPSSTESFLRDPSVLLVTRTFSFMRTIAIAAAALVLLALLLYLQARQRSQVIAAALSRRMGFRKSGEIASITLELAAMLVFAALVGGGIALAAAGPVVRHIDPLPQYAPGPIFVLPTAALFVAGVCLVALAAVAGAVTSWLAGRADVSEELRVA
jgi:putative ABC transport system permease protein